ncbi:hypothetical protein [Pseudomonas sp. CGJS7]|uniref:hypothetical protein n=1 Tax=Pseudomonas sp. CGJS7 TaxID=3109348 RepID=UPI00300BA8FD
MALTSDRSGPWREDTKLSTRRQNTTLGFAIAAALIVLSGCASTNGIIPVSDQAPTVERLLTTPLEGVTGRDGMRSAMIRAYEIKDLDSKHIDNRPKTLADNHILSMFWLEPAPVDFMSMAVAPQPCFPTERALHLTQAKPHSQTQSSDEQTYDASRNGILVSFSTTPDRKCVSYIHIETEALTVERILTEPLSGTAGRDGVRTALARSYAIDPSMTKYTNREPKVLADRQVVSLLWLEPPPADFMSISLDSVPCFSTQRALALTQAKPYSGSGGTSHPAYNAFKNGMLVGFTSTPDGKCVKAIHIEEDK